MKYDGGMKFSIDATKKMLRRRGLEPGGRVQQVIDHEVLRRCSPLVPWLEGDLEKSGTYGTRIGSGEVCYNKPYARYQYYGKSESGKPLKYTRIKGHKDAGSYWFERMKTSQKDQILEAAQKAARGE